MIVLTVVLLILLVLGKIAHWFLENIYNNEHETVREVPYLLKKMVVLCIATMILFLPLFILGYVVYVGFQAIYNRFSGRIIDQK